MNDHTGGSSRKNRRRRPGGPEGPQAADASDTQAQPAASLRDTESLQRLRDRVEQAVAEIARLRDENTALAARLREIDSRPASDAHRIALAPGEEPEALRRKITGFIEAIDRYLEREPEED